MDHRYGARTIWRQCLCILAGVAVANRCIVNSAQYGLHGGPQLPIGPMVVKLVSEPVLHNARHPN